MSEFMKSIIEDTDVSNMSMEGIQRDYDKAVNDLNNKLVEMQADVELLYQFHLNEVKEYFTALLNKKRLETV